MYIQGFLINETNTVNTFIAVYLKFLIVKESKDNEFI